MSFVENSVPNTRVTLEEYNQRNCEGIDPNVFFPHEKERDRQRIAVKAAQAICGGCIIKDACLAGALDRGEKEGLWGGVYFGVGSGRRPQHQIY